MWNFYFPSHCVKLPYSSNQANRIVSFKNANRIPDSVIKRGQHTSCRPQANPTQIHPIQS